MEAHVPSGGGSAAAPENLLETHILTGRRDGSVGSVADLISGLGLRALSSGLRPGCGAYQKKKEKKRNAHSQALPQLSPVRNWEGGGNLF